MLSDTCDANLKAEECCSTAHCLATYDEWEVCDELHALWGCVLDAFREGTVYYDECLEALVRDE